MTTATTETAAPRRFSIRGSLRTDPILVIASAVILVSALGAALAPVLAPYGPLVQSLAHRLEGPSAAHWLGTDTLGRDVLSRLMWGAQPTLAGVLVAVVVFTVTGVALGLLAGYFRGATDAVISAVADILMSVPGVVLILAVLAIFDQRLMPAMVMLGALGAGSLIRIVRGSVLTTRAELFVSAARVSGLRPARILIRHILPGIVGPVTIQASLFAITVLAVQTGLGFLNLGVIPPAPSWGGMVGEAAGNLAQAGFLLFVSGATISIVALSLALIGDGLRDADSRTRSSSIGAAPARPAPVRPRTPAQPTGAVLELTEVDIRIDGRDEPVVHDASLRLDRGEVMGLVGESGSGKTITSLSILGLLPTAAWVAKGSIRLDGVELIGMSRGRLRQIRGRRIGLISQEPMVALDPLFTVGNQLDAVLRHGSHLPRSQRRARAIELLDSVHLPDPRDTLGRYPHELSGGMAQRVAMAIALAGEPDLLIADEPTTALDVTVQAEILALLRELCDTRGLAVLLVTHDLGVVADVCDRAVVMEHGRIVEAADVDELFQNPTHPYTRALLQSTPSLLEER